MALNSFKSDAEVGLKFSSFSHERLGGRFTDMMPFLVLLITLITFSYGWKQVLRSSTPKLISKFTKLCIVVV